MGKRRKAAGFDAWTKKNNNGSRFHSIWKHAAFKRLKKMRVYRKKYEGIAERQYREKQEAEKLAKENIFNNHGPYRGAEKQGNTDDRMTDRPRNTFM